MKQFIIQGPDDFLDEVPLFWSNEHEGWTEKPYATKFDDADLAYMHFPIETVGVVICETGEFIEIAHLSSENIRGCEKKKKKTSFERHSEELPPEGDVCTKCGIWVCPECGRYIDESPYCVDCYKKSGI